MQHSIKTALLFTFLVLLSFAGTAQRRKNVYYTKYFKTTGPCYYTVYMQHTSRTPDCENYQLVGVVHKKNELSITLHKGDSYTFYVVYGQNDPCGEVKSTFQIEIDLKEKLSRWSTDELEDSRCH